MLEHLQSGDQTIAPEDSAWQAMPHFCEIEWSVQDKEHEQAKPHFIENWM